MSYKPTGPWDFQKVLQIVEETTYGSKVTASPAFQAIGANVYVKENSKTMASYYYTQGRRDLYRALKYGEVHTFNVKFQPLDTRLIRYGTELPGGSGTIEKSLNFLYSEILDGVENYQFYLGARCDITDIEITDSQVQLSQNWICKDIPEETTTHGLTTPAFASFPTADPWTGASSGANPLSIGGTNYDTARFHVKVDQKLEAIKPNGEIQIKMLHPTKREVAVDFDVWLKDTTLKAAVRALTNYSAVEYTLSSAGPKKISLGNVRWDERDVTKDAGQDKHTLEKFSGRAETVTVTA